MREQLAESTRERHRLDRVARIRGLSRSTGEHANERRAGQADELARAVLLQVPPVHARTAEVGVGKVCHCSKAPRATAMPLRRPRAAAVRAAARPTDATPLRAPRAGASPPGGRRRRDAHATAILTAEWSPQSQRAMAGRGCDGGPLVERKLPCQRRDVVVRRARALQPGKRRDDVEMHERVGPAALPIRAHSGDTA